MTSDVELKIIKLAVENAVMKVVQTANERIDNKNAELSLLTRRIDILQKGLEEIRDHEHCISGDCDDKHFYSQVGPDTVESGCIAAHRCCSAIATKTLKAADETQNNSNRSGR